MGKKLVLKLAFLIFSFSLFFIDGTNAAFTASTAIADSQFSIGEWETDGDGSGGYPTTTLTIDDGLVVDKKVENVGFETGGSIADWEELGSTARLESDFEATPQEGGWMARVGDAEDDGREVWENSLSQILEAGNKNLSFYYNFYTYDDVFDEPGFAFIINGQTVWDIYASDVDYYGDYDDSAGTEATGWQQACIDLTQFEDESLNASFYSGNTDDEIRQSWAYLDKVTTTEVVANASTEFHLTSNPSDAVRQYSIEEEEEWEDLSGPFFTLSSSDYDSGEYTVYYRSVKGELEEPANIIKVHLDKQAPEAITDLEIDEISTSSAMLSWTVPADFLGDEKVRSASYDIRYWEKGTSPCQASGWDTVDSVANPPMPRFPGEIQDFEIRELEANTAYCFTLKTCDTALNCSPLSTGIIFDEEGEEEGEGIVGGTTLVRDEVPEEGSGSVVINELMWMGSSVSSSDEWIELRNMTGEAINLDQWQIVKKRPDGVEECMYTFLDYWLPANGYVVVSEYDSDHSALAIQCPSANCFVVGAGDKNDKEESLSTFTLYNNKLQVKLYDGFWTQDGVNLIDTADDWKGAPAAGQHDIEADIYYSMERDNIPGDGTNPDNWHTCLADTAAYWDADLEKGTPGGLNLSENDLPSSLQTNLDFYFSSDKKSVGFKANGVSAYNQLQYEVTYSPSNREPQGITGTVGLNGENEVIKEDLVLGTASSGVYVYDTGMDKIYLKINLTGTGMPDRELMEELDY